MRSGFLAGLLSGGVVSGAVLGAVSVLTGPPGDSAPQAVPLEVPAGSEFDQSREDTEASLPTLQEPLAPDDVPQVEAPEPDDLSSLSGVDTEPAAAPQTGEAQGTLEAPEAQDSGSGIALQSEEPVLPNPQALSPEAPETESDLSISTEPAQPPAPEPVQEDSAFPTETTEPQDEPQTGTDATDAAGQAPAPEPENEGGDLSEPAEAAAEDPAPAAEEAAPEDTSPEDTAPDTAADAAPADDSTIGDLAQGVTTNRLPSVTDPAEPEAAAEPAGTATAEDPAEEAEDTRRPLERHAAEFENPEGKPLMAIILIDDGRGAIGPQALADFPYPISFAVNAAAPGAADRAAAYRAAGAEVLALVDLPETATARDAEVSMEAYLAAVPEAVAVMEGTGTGLQASREATEQLAPILTESGHGLVMFPQGLNTAQKLIAREGVPSASVFRDFDANGQDARAIRRFLDQAAFRADQEEGGVIMVGRLRAETISALLLWGLQDRASSVALAPVSAVLRAN